MRNDRMDFKICAVVIMVVQLFHYLLLCLIASKNCLAMQAFSKVKVILSADETMPFAVANKTHDFNILDFRIGQLHLG